MKRTGTGLPGAAARVRPKRSSSLWNRLQDVKQRWQQREFDPRDGGMPEEPVFDLREELSVDGVVGGGSAQGDAGDVASGHARDGAAGRIGIGGDRCALDQAGINEVASCGRCVAVAEEGEKVRCGH